MSWGVLDTQDNLWMGDDRGPILFEDEMLARISSQIVSDQILNTDLSQRFQAREYPGGPARIVDEITVRRTAVEALRRIEGESDGS